ncbi:MAG TPA: cation diffusion facilitator family transporter [Acidimicrobiia bacterium]|nr:cation diffusion facilitator family transporter [Acidimicrobiia bacterium]
MRTVSDSRARRALWIALGANAGLLAAELLGGFAFASLALLADAAHLATDVVGLAVALVAQTLVTRPASDRRTFGLRRAEALGAQANALLVLGAAVWIAVEAVGRLGTGHEVDGAGVVAVAAVALALNGVSAAVLAGVAGRRLNLRAALVHLLADVGSSFAVLIAGVGVLVFAADWLDPVASLAIAALVVWSIWGLLRDTTNVLLEAAPRDLVVGDVEHALAAAPGVEAVHHLHVWEVASDLPALSAHVVLSGAPTLHDAQARGDELKTMLAGRFGIAHATLELECHECDTPDH